MLAVYAITYALFQPINPVVAALGLPLAVLCLHALGMRRLVAVLGLLDLLLLPLCLFGFARESWQEGRLSFGPFVGAGAEGYAWLLIVVYAIGVGLTVGLLRRRTIPDWLAPATGIWARRLRAGLAICSFLFVLGGDLIVLAAREGFGWLGLLLVVGAVVVTYVTPAWDVLVRGWHPHLATVPERDYPLRTPTA